MKNKNVVVMENLVLNNLIERTTVNTCPECRGEYFQKEATAFIKKYGVCAHCDSGFEIF